MDTPRHKALNIRLSKFVIATSPHTCVKWNDIYHNDAGEGFNGRWSNYGWTDPNVNITTFKNEICTFFNSAKTVDSSIYGSDSGTINVYLIKYQYTNSKAIAWFPIFMKGNNPYRDETITV